MPVAILELLRTLLTSKRFLAVITSVVVQLMKSKLGLDDETANMIVAALLTFVVGDSISPVDPVKRVLQNKSAARKAGP